jgi:tetratricopeptide (TPR) repeat protein
MARRNLAGLYNSQGRYAEAEPLSKRSLTIIEKALGPDHPDVATSLNNLAELYRDQGRYAEAEPLFKRSLAIREKAPGPDHPDVATKVLGLINPIPEPRSFARSRSVVHGEIGQCPNNILDRFLVQFEADFLISVLQRIERAVDLNGRPAG